MNAVPGPLQSLVRYTLEILRTWGMNEIQLSKSGVMRINLHAIEYELQLAARDIQKHWVMPIDMPDAIDQNSILFREKVIEGDTHINSISEFPYLICSSYELIEQH